MKPVKRSDLIEALLRAFECSDALAVRFGIQGDVGTGLGDAADAPPLRKLRILLVETAPRIASS